jgi:hypothetical protein
MGLIMKIFLKLKSWRERNFQDLNVPPKMDLKFGTIAIGVIDQNPFDRFSKPV